MGEERAVLVDGVAVRYRVQALWKGVLDPAAEGAVDPAAEGAAAAEERVVLLDRV